MNNKKLGVTIVAVFSVLPIAYLFWVTPLENFFGSFQGIIRMIAKVTGLAAIMTYSLNMILGAFPDKFANLFGGVEGVRAQNKKMGEDAGKAIGLHVLAVIIGLILRKKGITPSPAILTGLVAFVFGGFFAYISTKRQDLVPLMQKLIGIPLFLATYHALLIPSDVSKNPFLKYYVLFFATLGLLGYIINLVRPKPSLTKQDGSVE